MTSLDDFMREIEAESQAEGPDAVEHLEAFRKYYRRDAELLALAATLRASRSKFRYVTSEEAYAQQDRSLRGETKGRPTESAPEQPIPPEFIIPDRILVTADSGATIIARIQPVEPPGS